MKESEVLALITAKHDFEDRLTHLPGYQVLSQEFQSTVTLILRDAVRDAKLEVGGLVSVDDSTGIAYRSSCGFCQDCITDCTHCVTACIDCVMYSSGILD